MTPQLIAVLANLIAQVLPFIGVSLGTDAITTAIQVIVAIVSGIWILIDRATLKKVGRSESDATLGGLKK